MKDATRRALARIALDSDAPAQRAQLAWDNGDGSTAIADWACLIKMQPRNPEWPARLSLVAETFADAQTAETIVRDAWARGARAPVIAECIRQRGAQPCDGARHVGEGASRRPAAVDGWLSPARDAALIRELGADTTVIGFTTLRGDGGMPVNAIHALFQPAKVNGIYLFDEQRIFNLAGSARFGRPYGTMIEGLRAQLEAWGTRTLIMFGFTGPGHTALRAGLDLDADGALLFSPVITLNRRPEFDIAKARGRIGDDSRLLHLEKYMRAKVPDMMINLHDSLAARAALKQIEIHYGTNLTDLVHINAIWDLQGSIDLHQIDFSRHEVLSEIVRRGDFDIAARFVEKVRASKR